MKKTVQLLAFMLTTTFALAQDDKPLEFSGSVDTYYKYDFSKNANIGTSFANEQNSLSIGMIDLALKKTTGKTSFVGEVSFGPRGQAQSIPNAIGSADETTANSFHIQNLYASYKATDKLSLTAGYMATFIGYEVISPVPNFHYSTSYLFTNGPFQNAGIKATYAFSDKVSLMAGAFNDQWNTYKADGKLGLNAVGAQLALMPTKSISAYINFLSGSASGTIIDLTATFQVTEKFKLGLNSADFSGAAEKTGFTGFALYPSYAITEKFGLGVRAEYFKTKENSGFSKIQADSSVTAFTLTGNLKAGSLTFIPEIRLDNAKEKNFLKENGDPTNGATQATLAVVYGF
jgi:Putative beta-barrel porin-2, OmpL-like. bbp2